VDERDALTQLLSRRAFDSHLTAALAEAKQRKEPLSLVMADIDHFKRVNDTHGHLGGDAVLRGVSARLIDVCRAKGQAYRFGGEELALVLPNHAPGESVSVAERARRTIEASTVEGIQVTLSFGVSSFPDHATDIGTLLRTADEALYDAKHRGRNVVRLHGEPAPTRPGAREPDRKLPEPGRLTDAQKAEMRRRLLRHERIECPEDGAYFDVHDVTHTGSVGREFLIMCPDCGMQDTLSGGSR
jgi:diguanylate cyclase (GGDEF)-like protein